MISGGDVTEDDDPLEPIQVWVFVVKRELYIKARTHI